ncbi:MAG: hypothetical protein RQ826_17570 [Xanthomonadales bacterium]|nr:hypothetical protein [Xanthomonadales bacterium]
MTDFTGRDLFRIILNRFVERIWKYPRTTVSVIVLITVLAYTVMLWAFGVTPGLPT